MAFSVFEDSDTSRMIGDDSDQKACGTSKLLISTLTNLIDQVALSKVEFEYHKSQNQKELLAFSAYEKADVILENLDYCSTSWKLKTVE